ncbi:protein CMSS1 [Spea bombifrons]|uniref:protein CMSS1 n=1 Tax=Spea bombifrons TaxID=233779 RepID=UPI00234B1B9E|nr:protein CMSS1 [Spea bombifrons]
MADDLGDEWWEEPAGEEQENAGDVKSEETLDTKTTKKRKKPASETLTTAKKKKPGKECILTQPENKEEAPAKIKRRKKKTITDVLATSVPKAGSPEDLQNLLLQHFDNTRSVIELEELKLPDTCFVKANDLTHTLSSYLNQTCPKWSKISKNHKEKKSVLLLVVCSSAHRALELIKLINAFKGDTKIMKMFAKHIKIQDQIKMLEKNVIHLGVGTPGRIKALIGQDGLSLSSLKYIVLDWNWRDQKLRRMMDIPEVKKETLELLEGGLLSACKAGSVKLGLF